MNVVSLAHQGCNRMELKPAFCEKVHLVSDLLKGFQILSINRAGLNSKAHRPFCAAIALASESELNTTLDVHTRNCETYYLDGLSTRFVGWLDKAVAAGVLECDNPLGKAHGRLRVANRTNRFLAKYG